MYANVWKKSELLKTRCYVGSNTCKFELRLSKLN